jgi:hypothetical protein
MPIDTQRAWLTEENYDRARSTDLRHLSGTTASSSAAKAWRAGE